MLGGRLFWFLVGIGVGIWARSWFRKNLTRKTLQRKVAKRVKSITEDIKVAISQDKRADERNGY